MRIGMFAKLNNMSIDTIRYYVDLKLIHPVRKGRYYYFNEEQQAELDLLIYLKKLRFTLEEIKKIVTIRELSKIKTGINSSIYEDMLIKKKDALELEISELSDVLSEIDNEIKQIREKQTDTYIERGIEFNHLLELICCPNCGKAVEINEGILKGNGIYEGVSQCDCGYSFSINQGIIVVEHNQDNIIEPYIDNQNYIDEFIDEAPKSYIDFMMQSSKEVIRLLTEKKLADKVLLFMKSGLGALEMSLLEHTMDIQLMILVDDDFNKLKIAKKSIQTSFPSSNIIYICSDFNELPIKKKSVDIAVDFPATFVNGFRLAENMYDYIIPLLKEKSSIIGLFLYFKSFDLLSRLMKDKRKLFDGRTVPRSIEEDGYIQTSHYEEYILHEGSNINNFFIDGDKVHSKIMVFER